MHDRLQQKTWLTLAALACEGAAACALLMDQRWLVAVVLHAGCALGLALQSDVSARRTGAICIALWSWSLPVLGPLGIGCVVLPAWRKRRSAQLGGVLELELPVAMAAASAHANPARPVTTPIELVLRGTRPEAVRIAAVLRLRSMETARALPLLRLALTDAHEEVRLLAYAILERREQQLRAAIELGLRSFARLPEAKRASVSAMLCEQHFELVRARFVTGELAEGVLRRAMEYGVAALRLRADGASAVMLGRIGLHCGDAAGALDYFKLAAGLGIASSVLAPLYAEAAFLMRRFDALPPLLAASAGGDSSRPELQAVADFWCQRSEA